MHVAAGATVLIVSDRAADAASVPIPSLLAVAAVHHHLIGEQTRTGVGLIVESGEAREVAHVALLIGFGAEAVNPYLAIDSIAALDRRGLLKGRGAEEARAAYVAALCTGLLKTIAKMGISTLESYCGAQAFEAIGLGDEVIDAYFPGTASRIGGIGLQAIAREAIERHDAAYATESSGEGTAGGGEYAWREDGPAAPLAPRRDRPAAPVRPKRRRGGVPRLRRARGQRRDRGTRRAPRRCSTSARTARRSTSVRWSRSRPCCRASRPGRCPSVRSAPRRTRRSRSP